ncbi:MAG: C25 family cysteine peptidase [Candidatus Neomarinimicrobiota bacterium]
MQIVMNRPGLLVLEVAIDTVFIKNQSEIITAPALEQSLVPGYPAMPVVAEVIVGVPPDATVEFFTDAAHTISGLVPVVTLQEQAKGIEYTVAGPTWNGSPYPAVNVQLTDAGRIRGHTSSILRVNPVLIVAGELIWHKNISVKLTWSEPATTTPVLLSQINLSDLPRRQLPTLTRTTSTPAYQFSANLVRITIDTTGWYSLPRSTLVDSGLSIRNVDPATFRLWNADREILIYVEGQTAGEFNRNDRIIFYGEKNPPPAEAPYQNNFYTNENVYWLTWGGEPGLRYIAESAYPDLPENQVLQPPSFRHTEHIERDEYFARLGSMGTHQQWDTFDHFFMEPPINGGTSRQFDLFLPGPRSTTASKFQVKMEIQGITNGEHALQAFLNNYQVADARWTGQQAQIISSDPNKVLLNNYLTDGANGLLITLEGDDPTNLYDQVYLNWVEITYDRLYRATADQIVFTRASDTPVVTQFEVTGFSSPDIWLFKENLSRLQDFVVLDDAGQNQFNIIFQDFPGAERNRYHAFTDDQLRTVKNLVVAEPLTGATITGSAPYLILAPDSFFTTLEPLVEIHNGLAVNIDEVYRRYSHGRLSPYAINEFLKDIYYNWPEPLQTVLIAMQGDQLGWQRSSVFRNNFIPSMKIQTVKWGAAAADFWYTLIDDDLLPEIAIGRLPARDIPELEQMVAKTLTLLESAPRNWHDQVLMIAGYNNTFKEQSEMLISNILDRGIFPIRLNIDQYSVGGLYYGNTDSLLQYFSRGLLYINFLGHGGGAVWGDRSIFTLEDVSYLDNKCKTPFVTSMTCHTGDVTNPNALGRRLMSYDNGGVAAWFGSAGVGWIINDYLLLQPIHKHLFETPGIPFGQLINQAKIEYYLTNSAFPDIAKSQIYQFNLSGDPALTLPFYDQSSIAISSNNPEPGETISIQPPDSPCDSLRILLFDDDRNPPTKYPQTIEISADQKYYYNLADTLRPGNYTLVASWQAGGRGYRASAPLTVSGSYAVVREILPVNPTFRDSLWLTAQVSDRQGIAAVRLLINSNDYAGLVDAGGETYQLAQPLPPFAAGTTLNFRCRVTDSTGQVSLGPEKTIIIRDLPQVKLVGLTLKTENDLQLAAQVQNTSIGVGTVTVRFQRRDGNNWLESGADTIQFAGAGLLPAQTRCALPAGRNTIRAIATAETGNDTLSTELLTDAFWLTGPLGSTTDRLNHSVVGVDGIEVEIAPGATAADMVLKISDLNTPVIPRQPDLAAVRVDTLRLGVELFCTAEISADISWKLPATLPDSVKLFTWYPEREIWLPVLNVIATGDRIGFTASAPGRFAFLTSRDVTRPCLEAAINGQRFLRDSYLNSTPLISLVGQDDNGIDHRSSAFTVWINQQKIAAPAITVMSGQSNQLGLQYSPILSRTDTSMAIVAHDASGNASDTLQLKFIVREKLELIDYGNFPNPFTDQTRFAYELTESVDDFHLDIYTVDGRRIRRLTGGSTLTDLDPRAGAYHEIIWDGRDRSGDFVANGVYFYQIKVTKGKTTIEKRGKIAKAR